MNEIKEACPNQKAIEQNNRSIRCIVHTRDSSALVIQKQLTITHPMAGEKPRTRCETERASIGSRQVERMKRVKPVLVENFLSCNRIFVFPIVTRQSPPYMTDLKIEINRCLGQTKYAIGRGHVVAVLYP